MCGEFIGAITFDFIDRERSLSMSFLLRRLISHKGAELGHVLLLFKVIQTLKAYMS